MRSKWGLFTLFAAATVLLGAVVVAAFDRRDRDRDALGYNVLAERMFKGVAASKEQIINGLMYFRLKTANTVVEVQVGPKEFVEGKGFKLNTGDVITVIGMPIVMKGQQVVLAREIRSMNGTLIVRDAVGLPLWDRPLQMDPERQRRPDEICDLGRF